VQPCSSTIELQVQSESSIQSATGQPLEPEVDEEVEDSPIISKVKLADSVLNLSNLFSTVTLRSYRPLG
jgi:hypothetical protein